MYVIPQGHRWACDREDIVDVREGGHLDRKAMHPRLVRHDPDADRLGAQVPHIGDVLRHSVAYFGRSNSGVQ